MYVSADWPDIFRHLYIDIKALSMVRFLINPIFGWILGMYYTVLINVLSSDEILPSKSLLMGWFSLRQYISKPSLRVTLCWTVLLSTQKKNTSCSTLSAEAALAECEDSALWQQMGSRLLLTWSAIQHMLARLRNQGGLDWDFSFI